jgi:hypothetical protein
MGSPNFQSNKDVTLLNITGDESSLSDPIYDAVPVRCRPINGQYFSMFAEQITTSCRLFYKIAIYRQHHFWLVAKDNF